MFLEKITEKFNKMLFRAILMKKLKFYWGNS